MKRWLGYSGGLHVLLLLIIVFGLPVLFDNSDIIHARVIPVDIVNISDVTNTRVSDKPNLNPTPTPTKVEKQEPPPTPEPKEEKKADKPTEKPDDKAEALPDKTKPKEKEKPKEEKKEEKKPEKKPEKKTDLTSVLKNVAKLKDDIKPQPDVVTKETSDKAVLSDETPSLGQTLSISEMDALRRQITQCWNVPIGARGIEDMKIEIYIEVNEDKTVRRAEIVDKARMITDSFFRTVAESARRSLFNPKCSPLMVPDGKYAEWQKIRMTFSSADMM